MRRRGDERKPLAGLRRSGSAAVVARRAPAHPSPRLRSRCCVEGSERHCERRGARPRRDAGAPRRPPLRGLRDALRPRNGRERDTPASALSEEPVTRRDRLRERAHDTARDDADRRDGEDVLQRGRERGAVPAARRRDGRPAALERLGRQERRSRDEARRDGAGRERGAERAVDGGGGGPGERADRDRDGRGDGDAAEEAADVYAVRRD